MSNIINLITYKELKRTNFGDELSYVILKFLFEKYKISVDKILINKKHTNNICFIGSMLHWSNNVYDNNIYILGSGIRTENDILIKHKKMKIYSVRGPLTKDHINKYDYDSPDIFGDPALLLPRFYKPNLIDKCYDKIGVVGHLTNFDKYNNLPTNFILINPTWEWNVVVDYIFSCKMVLSSSLHGIIIADAYNKPNIWLNEYKLNEGEFKFNDYLMSQNRKINNIKSINNYTDINPYTGGNTIDLDKIETAFIQMCRDLELM